MEWHKPQVLVVDDDPDARELVVFSLAQASFETMTAENGVEALAKARVQLPDAIVLDVMLPDIDGMEVCRTLRCDTKTAALPVIMVSAKAAEVDRVLGLEVGADDYLTKPFSPRELVLRIKKMLHPRQTSPDNGQLRIGEIVIDLPKHEVNVAGRRIDLTLTEFNLIWVMAQRCRTVQSREQLLHDVWDYESASETRTVDTHVRRLREKLGPAAGQLDTVRGLGYRLLEKPHREESSARTTKRKLGSGR